MRKYVLLVLAVVFLTVFQPVGKAEALTDLKRDGRTEIERLVSEGIIAGFSDGTFRPDRNVTRAEAITMIGRALQWNTTNKTSSFQDVRQDHFAATYIREGVERKIVSGYSDGTFRPNNPITRAEMAMFLSRAFPFPQTADHYFLDVDQSVQGANEINRLAAARITAGYPNGTYRPGQAITRHEFSLLLARSMYEPYRISMREPLPDVKINVKKAVVYNTESGLNVRAEPNTSGAPIGRLTNGTVIDYFATVGNWAMFFYEGKVSYVSLSYLTSPNGLKGKTIVIDPGHGGRDSGAIGNGITEKEHVLEVSLLLREKLRAAGVNAVMTRQEDQTLTLAERSTLANNIGADAFISIHNNAFPDPGPNGTETYWNRTHAAAESRQLAEQIQKQLLQKLKTNDRGVKEAGFYVIKNTRMPSVLVELGFITNSNEAERMKTEKFKEDSAEAIFLGIKAFFEQ